MNKITEQEITLIGRYFGVKGNISQIDQDTMDRIVGFMKALRSISRKKKVCVCKGYVTELYEGFSLENLIIVKSKFCGWCGGELKESK